MFEFIKGTLVQASPISTTIDVGGIGYKVLVPASAFSKLPAAGNPTQLFTSLVVREMSQTLYGFLSPDERDVFEILLGVSGIGPKIALSLIGHLSIGDLQKAIQNHDSTLISKVPGIGKKTAERLIIELRDKFASLSSMTSPSDFAINMPMDPRSQAIQDAMNALINLGYNQMSAQKAIKLTLKELPEEVDLATLITETLKVI